jgi:hypothetical protein
MMSFGAQRGAIAADERTLGLDVPVAKTVL